MRTGTGMDGSWRGQGQGWAGPGGDRDDGSW